MDNYFDSRFFKKFALTYFGLSTTSRDKNYARLVELAKSTELNIKLLRRGEKKDGLCSMCLAKKPLSHAVIERATGETVLRSGSCCIKRFRIFVRASEIMAAIVAKFDFQFIDDEAETAFVDEQVLRAEKLEQDVLRLCKDY